jgi:hypothetical protein
MSIYYFVIPIVIIAGILIGIPKFMTKGKSNRVQNLETATLPEQSLVGTSFETPKQENNTNIIQNNPGEPISDIVLPSPEMNSTVPQPIDENVLNNMVTRAIDPFQKEIIKMQETISDLRAEINSVKTNLTELTLTFETSLTDLKAFQTEIANPLNFMRKYFDSIDIKNLSDPTFPLRVEQPIQFSGQNSNKELLCEPEHQIENNHISPTSNAPVTKQNEEISIKQELPESLPFKQLFNGSLTLGKLMTTTTVLEEILQTVDRDSIDILIEQCKLMGLKQEDEHVIYNIINLMDQSGLSVKEVLLMLYKFGQVMGLADKEADLIYAKLMMNQGKPHSSIMTVESKGN